MSITPTEVTVQFWRWFWVGVGALAVLVITISVLHYTVWQQGWWFASQNASREAHVIRNGFSNQQTLREQITQQIANVDSETVSIAQAAGDPGEVAALKAQRIAVVNIACQDGAEVTGDPLPAQQQAWMNANCLAGVIRPGSRYDTTGATQ